MKNKNEKLKIKSKDLNKILKKKEKSEG